MKILHLISSPRGNESVSIKLGNAIVEKLLAANPGSTVKTHDLVKYPFPHLEEAHLASFFTPAEQHTPELAEAIKHSDEALKELFDADVIVIGAPMYNFSIPSSLKAWIDHIVRAQKTFRYGENGPIGLVEGKRVYVAISSGGVYSEGNLKAIDFIEPYIKTVFGFLGMTNISFHRAEGLKIPGIQETALEKGIASVEV
ncbi:FMN-dependent NADH-azoreductase [Mucilaginibacter sp. MD40]|uniref:FMN-dependent NADH-azoreductase n=1 Tax=Mucilaginibacter sp. MD40 TaxID=2029590 RepID=UPI000BAC6854|nr:FMN-dependent NADH-azoreductase [Mucilaginibacter sp. MD40]PAW94546.1 FMN-dependent NADH-azoreductase [Mucilaginibacter sp. MD40]